MALPHARPLDLIDLGPLGKALPGRQTHSLLKTTQLQLMRVVLAAGQALPEHRVPGEITIQCLEGEAVVHTPSRDCPLRAGTLVMLPGGEPHGVRALSDCSLLVTVLLRP